MKSTAVGVDTSWELPYYQSASLNITLKKSTPNVSGLIKLQDSGGNSDNSIGFVYALQPLNLNKTFRFVNTSTSYSQVGLDETDVKITAQAIEILFASSVKNAPLMFAMYVWWKSSVKEIYMSASSALTADVNFNGTTGNLQGGVPIHFYTS